MYSFHKILQTFRLKTQKSNIYARIHQGFVFLNPWIFLTFTFSRKFRDMVAFLKFCLAEFWQKIDTLL